MKFRSLLPLAALLVAVGCQDARPTQSATAEIKDIVVPSLSTSSEEQQVYTGRSTICVAYDNRLADLQAQLDANPGDADLQARVADFESRIADSCGSVE